MAKRSLPPGFRFHPTDAELVKYYLKRKVMGQRLHFDAISELNIYNYCPWDLPDKSCLGSKDLVWYFFCPNEKKYASGARTNRATESGYWKSTGKDRPVFYNHQTVGMVKTLVFHIGRSPRGQRTNWVLYEYRIQDKELTDVGIVQDAYVLCKVFQKSGPGPKANAQYGAPLSEEDWDDDAEYGLSLPSSSLLPPELPHNNDISVRICMYISGSTFCGPSTESSPSNILPSTNEVTLAFPNNEDLSCLSDIMKDSSYVLPDHTVNSEVVENFSDKNNIESLTGLDGAEMDYVLGDVYTGGELSGGGSNEKNSEGLTCLDGDGIGLEDLDNWPELTGGEFSLTSTHTADYGGGVPFAAGEKMEFLELDDLNSPLNFTTEATGSQYSLTDIFFEPWHNNCLGEDYLPVDNFGANQHVPVMNQLPMLPEEYNGHGNLFGLFQENSGLIENADLGFTAASYWEDIFTSCEHLEDTTGRLAGKDNHG